MWVLLECWLLKNRRNHVKTNNWIAFRNFLFESCREALLQTFHPTNHKHFFSSQAKSAEDAERGLLFMQEMIELSKSNAIPATELQVRFLLLEIPWIFNWIWFFRPFPSRDLAVRKWRLYRLDRVILDRIWMQSVQLQPRRCLCSLSGYALVISNKIFAYLRFL